MNPLMVHATITASVQNIARRYLLFIPVAGCLAHLSGIQSLFLTFFVPGRQLAPGLLNHRISA